jgi:two-component system sensor histidine kinase/response regulator
MGNSRIYYNALRRFVTYVDAARGVESLLAAGDRETAHRTVHTLKGAAGLLGAGEVQDAASRVETALAQGETVNALLDDLAGALARVQVRIDAAIGELAPEAPQRTGEADVPALLERLDALFDEGNGAAIDLIETWNDVLREALGAAAWDTVTAAAYDYDFDGALAALRGARQATAR